MTRLPIRLSMLWLAAVAFFLATPSATSATGGNSSEQSEAAEEKVQGEVDEKLAKRREKMMAEARAALDETNEALAALDDGNSTEALEALARATGKLELIVARDPDLALAPIDVGFVTHDLYATPAAIRSARDRAGQLLEDGKVQEARALLAGLASEVVIRVTNLPIATYPDAIKMVSPLIDQGKTEEAKTALRTALSTLVVTDQVISLPVLRARYLLDEAEALAQKDEPTKEQKTRIEELVTEAREHLEVAELLGYGDKRDHEEFRAEIAELENKIRGDEETQGVFARLRRSLDGFESSFFE